MLQNLCFSCLPSALQLADPKFRRASGLDSWFFAGGCCLLPFLRAGEGLSAEHVAVCPGFAVRSAWFFQLKKFMLYAFSFWSALRLAFRHIADSRLGED